MQSHGAMDWLIMSGGLTASPGSFKAAGDARARTGRDGDNKRSSREFRRFGSEASAKQKTLLPSLANMTARKKTELLPFNTTSQSAPTLRRKGMRSSASEPNITMRSPDGSQQQPQELPPAMRRMPRSSAAMPHEVPPEYKALKTLHEERASPKKGGRSSGFADSSPQGRGALRGKGGTSQYPQEPPGSGHRRLRALGSITTAATAITGSLTESMKACDKNLTEFSNDMQSLAVLSTTSQNVFDFLAQQEAPFSSPTNDVAVKPYSDPMIKRARQLNEMTLQLCGDFEGATHHMGEAITMSPESASLREICSVTKLVSEQMSSLQEEGWAAGVLAQITGEKTRKRSGRPELSEARHGSSGTSGGQDSPKAGRRPSLQEGQAPAASSSDAKPSDQGHAAHVQKTDSSAGKAAAGSPKSSGNKTVGFKDGGEGAGAPQKAAAKSDANNTRSAMDQKGSFNTTDAKDDLQEILAEVAAVTAEDTGDGFSNRELNKFKAGFKRFKDEGGSDLHTEELTSLLRYMGHVMITEEEVTSIIRQVTSFEYIDFDEFLDFLGRFVPWERNQFKAIFETFDEDQSGFIDVDELRKLLSKLGFMPLRAMIMEALSVVDSDGSGNLGFKEFVACLAVYRHFEGFTRKEVALFRRIFERFGNMAEHEKLLDSDDLGDALVQCFGLSVADQVGDMVEEIAAENKRKNKNPEPLAFNEFLIYARRTREATFAKLRDQYPNLGTNKGEGGAEDEDGMAVGGDITDSEPGSDEDDEGDDPAVVAERKKRRADRAQRRTERNAALAEAADRAEFAGADNDGDGLISEKELAGVLAKMGYTPLKQLLDEIYAEVDKDGNKQLDFDEFFDFTLIFTQREGFSVESFDYMKKLFEQTDVDDSGEISALELAKLFRQMGYRSSMDEIHVFVQQVDVNGSNQLDFREFLRLMRLHREDELNKILEVFKRYQAEDGAMKGSDLRDALEELEQELPAGTTTGQLPKVLNFDAFVDLCDWCRKDMVEKERKKAGFTDDQLANFQELYNRFDEDKSGEIDNMELMGVLQEFGWEPRSREEQKVLMGKIDAAREAARDAGIKDVGEDGSGCITFWVFIQLARTLETEKEEEEQDRLDKVIDDSGFSQKEVDDFRQVFLARKKEFTEVRAEDQMAEGKPEPKGLNRQCLRQLVKSLGVKIVGELKEKMDTKLVELDVEDEHDQMDFGGFLQLMKWVLDTDFAGLSGKGGK